VILGTCRLLFGVKFLVSSRLTLASKAEHPGYFAGTIPKSAWARYNGLAEFPGSADFVIFGFAHP
jgi:hypothetical protein